MADRHKDIFDLVSDIQKEAVKEKRKELKERKREKERQKEREWERERDTDRDKEDDEVLCSIGIECFVSNLMKLNAKWNSNIDSQSFVCVHKILFLYFLW